MFLDYSSKLLPSGGGTGLDAHGRNLEMRLMALSPGPWTDPHLSSALIHLKSARPSLFPPLGSPWTHFTLRPLPNRRPGRAVFSGQDVRAGFPLRGRPKSGKQITNDPRPDRELV